MNTRFKEVFRGKVVNKRLTVNTGVDEFPRFVVEYLIDNYCTEETFQQRPSTRSSNSCGGEFRSRSRGREDSSSDSGDSQTWRTSSPTSKRLKETEDKYWGTIGAINESFVNVTESLVRQCPMLLSGGMWGTITLDLRRNRGPQQEDSPLQGHGVHPVPDFDHRPQRVHRGSGGQFEDGEWLDFLINSIGLNPGAAGMTRREKLLYLWRLVPMIEANCNTIELAPRGNRRKTYIYRNQSYYVTVLSGGEGDPGKPLHQQLHRQGRRSGQVGTWCGCSTRSPTPISLDPKALVSIMQGFMQDAKFSRGKKRKSWPLPPS